MRLCLDRIRTAVSNIEPGFRHTPQYECEPLGKELGCHIVLKVETLNPIRCFKGRGTEVVMSKVAVAGGNGAAVCASAGNLGQALAYSGRSRDIPTTVVASVNANAVKVQRMRDLGATVRLVDGDIEAARQLAREIAIDEKQLLVEDSENVDTCEGAATIGLELVRYPSTLDTVLIALGGGAMATGVGFVCKCLAPTTKIVCVQPAGAPAMTLSWRSKKIIQTETIDTIADGVAGRCPIPEVLSDLIEVADDALLVSEQSIIQGMRLLNKHAGLVVEPSAALGLAAILENREHFQGQRVATIICGSNVDCKDFRRWVP